MHSCPDAEHAFSAILVGTNGRLLDSRWVPFEDIVVLSDYSTLIHHQRTTVVPAEREVYELIAGTRMAGIP